MKSLLLTLPLSIAILLTGCSALSVREAEKSSIFAMDTYMSFTVYGDAVLLEDAEHLIRSIEESVSVTDENSAIYAVNHTGEGIYYPRIPPICWKDRWRCAAAPTAPWIFPFTLSFERGVLPPETIRFRTRTPFVLCSRWWTTEG